MNDVVLRPFRYISVSGGKDSLYMFRHIIDNQDKYPFDMVVHFDLEIDWQWSKNVVDYIERCCFDLGIPFIRIKPNVSYFELVDKYGFPYRTSRWCNSQYKLNCKRQLESMIKSWNCRPVAYIGFCSDEVNRFKYEVGSYSKDEPFDVVYPLAEDGISESFVLEWAKNCDLFNGYYNVFRRQGCKFCPNATQGELAYLYLKYPDDYKLLGSMVRSIESKTNKPVYNYFWDRNNQLVQSRWVERIKSLIGGCL